MSETNRLTQDFAKRFPQAFADLLTHADEDDAREVLEALPAANVMAVLARLPSGRLSAIAVDTFIAASARLRADSIDDTATFLAHQPLAQRADLIGKVTDRSLHRKLQQRLNFSSHTVGALTTDPTDIVSADTPLEDVLSVLRSVRDRREVQIVLVDTEGRYVGVLDPWKILGIERAEGAVRRFVSKRPALAAEVSIAAAHESGQWLRASWLPVVDYDNRVLGVVNRADVLNRSERADDPAVLMANSVSELARQYVFVLGELLSRITSGWGVR